ncbi:hypothetical protein GQ54DRAFT_310480 [Martensiomyces pterosporus]|nr:hypothetical protein GQ54DRAFT_310480 [Martensiomyces pterosporus]
MAASASPPATPQASTSNNPFFAMMSTKGSSSANAKTSSPSVAELTKEYCKPLMAHIDAQTNSQDSAYIWSAPAIDPQYWANIAKARSIRHSVSKMKDYLARTRQQPGDQQRDEEIRRLMEEIRLGERKLMKYVNHYILNYDDIINPDRGRTKPPAATAGSGENKAAVVAQSRPRAKHHELGTISPPMSPNTAPARPLPPTPTTPSTAAAPEAGKATKEGDVDVPPLFASGTLPPTPAAASASQQQKKHREEAEWTVVRSQPEAAGNPEGVMDSRAFITSYKQKSDNSSNSDDNKEGEGGGGIKGASGSFEGLKEKRKSKLTWNGLFGGRNTKPNSNDSTSTDYSGYSSITNSQPSDSPKLRSAAAAASQGAPQQQR